MTTSPVADAEAVDDKVTVLGRTWPYKYVVAIVYVTALFLDILDLTIVNVAIPALGREFATENAEWVVLGYTLSLAVWIPASGWLGDRFGTKTHVHVRVRRVRRRFAAVRVRADRSVS